MRLQRRVSAEDRCVNFQEHAAVCKTVADSRRLESFTALPRRRSASLEDRCVSQASGEVEKRAELPAHGRLLHGDIAGELVLVEQSPNRREESRQLARARSVVPGSARVATELQTPRWAVARIAAVSYAAPCFPQILCCSIGTICAHRQRIVRSPSGPHPVGHSAKRNARSIARSPGFRRSAAH